MSQIENPSCDGLAKLTPSNRCGIVKIFYALLGTSHPSERDYATTYESNLSLINI